MTQQLTVKSALICYALGGVTAFAGFYHRAFLIMGMSVLFGISIFMEFFGGN